MVSKPANISANIVLAIGVSRCPTLLRPDLRKPASEQAFALESRDSAGHRTRPAEALVMKGSAVRIRSSALGFLSIRDLEGNG